MSLLRFIKWVLVMTVMSLVYIHMQMQIYASGYERVAYEKQVRKLLEKNGDVTHTILTLTSADNLGRSVLEKDSRMQFMDSKDIVALRTSEKNIARADSLEQKISRKVNPLLSLLSFEGEAQAKPIKE